jgi:DNA-binding XRE family transcriptional regulator
MPRNTQHLCHLTLRAPKPKNSAYLAVLITLGDRLRARRLDLGLYQKDVAAIIGVTVDPICYWENNRVRPSPRLRSMINHFGTRGNDGETANEGREAASVGTDQFPGSLILFPIPS